MKLEHRAIIENANRHGAMPSEMAHELLEHDLVQLCIDQLKGLTAPYNKLSETAQQDTIERITLGVKDAVKTAIRIIAANGVITIPVDVKRVQVDAAKLTVTATVDGKDPKKHDLIDSAGHLCLLVMAPDNYGEGLDGITPERNQRELPLSAAELAAGMRLDSEPEEGAWGATDSLYPEAVQFVVESQRASISAVQRKLKIGYNRAARLIEALEEGGVVSAMNSNGSRDVLLQSLPSAGNPGVDPLPEEPAPAADTQTNAFGGHTIDEITVMVLRKHTIDIGWLQSRFAISLEDAQRVTLQLLEANVIVLESEGDTPDLNTYHVTAAAPETVELE